MVKNVPKMAEIISGTSYMVGLHRALAAAGPVQELVSRVLRDKLVKIVEFTQKQR